MNSALYVARALLIGGIAIAAFGALADSALLWAGSGMVILSIFGLRIREFGNWLSFARVMLLSGFGAVFAGFSLPFAELEPRYLQVVGLGLLAVAAMASYLFGPAGIRVGYGYSGYTRKKVWRDDWSERNEVNPATGLPMCGAVDSAGNPFGVDYSDYRNDAWS